MAPFEFLGSFHHFQSDLYVYLLLRRGKVGGEVQGGGNGLKKKKPTFLKSCTETNPVWLQSHVKKQRLMEDQEERTSA